MLCFLHIRRRIKLFYLTKFAIGRERCIQTWVFIELFRLAFLIEVIPQILIILFLAIAVFATCLNVATKVSNHYN